MIQDTEIDRGQGVILFGGMLVLSLGGMWHIDRKRERQYGSA